jgi:hypothetical protein
LLDLSELVDKGFVAGSGRNSPSRGLVGVPSPGLSGSVAGVSLALSFVTPKAQGFTREVGSLSGHVDPVTGKATVTASGRTALSGVVPHGC